MHMTVRQCTSCGREDLRERWPSLDAAIQAGALRAEWACPTCAWPECDLVESVGGSGRTRESAATPVGPSNDASSEQFPDDPDERRRAIQSSLPLGHS